MFYKMGATHLYQASEKIDLSIFSKQELSSFRLVFACDCFRWNSEGHFPLGGIFREERHFLLFKDKLAESGSQKTKENIIPRGKFRLVENGPKKVEIDFSKVCTISFERPVNYLCDAWHIFPPKYEASTHFNRP